MRLGEDIAVMLPDSDPSLVRMFRSLQNAPFGRAVLVDLEACEDGVVETLPAVAQDLASRLRGGPIVQCMTGPPASAGTAFFEALFAAYPMLFSEDDERLLAPLADDPEAAAERLRASMRKLNGPQGMVEAFWIERDPAGMRDVVLRKLRHLAVVPGMRLRDGVFVDATGRHALLVAKVAFPLTDVAGGERLSRHISAALSELPPGVKARWICGHRYTVANARVVKSDLARVISASVLGLLIVFLVFLRTWRSLPLFAIPGVALLAGIPAVSLFFDQVSAITVGFGAVLLGISIDYGLHVYFGLRGAGDDQGKRLGELAKPLFVSAITTVGAFAVLLTSALPLQRQLALFSTAGLLAALALALLWLPNWVPSDPGRRRLVGMPRLDIGRVGLCVWVVVMIVGAALASKVSFDGSLQRVGYMPPDVVADEQAICQIWGNPRGQASVIVEAPDLETLLEKNERVYRTLRKGRDGGAGVVSLAPLLPSRVTQLANLQRWRAFWQRDGRGEALLKRLRIEGARLGFTEDAFAEFADSLEGNVPSGTIEDLARQGAPLFESLLRSTPAGVTAVTLMPDDEATWALVESQTGADGEDVAILSRAYLGRNLGRVLSRDFRRFLALSLTMAVCVLAAIVRRPGRILLGLLPAMTGLVVMFGAMGAAGLPLNLFNIGACVLVLGLSVDYGVFMGLAPERRDRSAETAVLVSGLTTLVGFGALVLARHPAMFSIGFTVLLGVVPSLLCALLVVPKLRPWIGK
ncbi:MAG: transporter [Lentisphaeria bacterium]|nr:transporter [Lentisphaeria bacterium]